MHWECPECDEETLHKTLKGRTQGKKKLELVLKCSSCGNVHKEILEALDDIKVRMIISRGDVSEKAQGEFPEDWVLAIDDEFMHDEERLKVTGLEVDGKRVEKAPVKTIQTLWTINFDLARVKVSINRDGRTRSLDLEVDPEEEFTVGTRIEIDGIEYEIHSIKLKHRSIRRGTAEARDILRVYCTDQRPPPRRRR